MRQRTINGLLLIVLMSVGLAGCRSDVQLDQVTVDSNVHARLSLPIGEVRTSFANLIGLFGQQSTVIINEDSVLEVHISKHYDRQFHNVDLASYVGRINQSVAVQTASPGTSMLPAGTSVRMPFELAIKFNDINSNLSNERVDSMLITEAKFTTRITPSADLGITDEDIESVHLLLGDRFNRAAGKEINLPGFKFGQDFPVVIDNFSLSLMKDASQAAGDDNIVSEAGITFVITLKTTGEDKVVSPASGFNFVFEVRMLDYKALYGFFEAGKDTRDARFAEAGLELPGGEELILPVKDPEITLKFTYGLSMPLNVRVNSIKAIHPNNEETPATWGGSTTTLIPLNTILPINAPLDTIAVDSSIVLTKNQSSGAIDKFFLKQVIDLWYDYQLEVDRERPVNGKIMTQHRITSKDSISVDFDCKLPLDFHPGLTAGYGDTIKDISLERVSLDSLAAMTNGLVTRIDSADLHLYLTITNEIPVDLQLDGYLLDEDGKEIGQLSHMLKQINIVGATISGSQIATATSTYVVGIKNNNNGVDEFDELAKTRAIRFHVHLGDVDKQKASRFCADRMLSIKAGVTADVQAVLNLAASSNNQNN